VADELLELPKPFKSSFILTDPSSPLWQQVMDLRDRIAQMLHRAATIMRDGDAGESESVEPVKFTVTTIGTLLTSYGVKNKQYSGAQVSFSGMQASKKIYEGQRKHLVSRCDTCRAMVAEIVQRYVFMAAASVHHREFALYWPSGAVLTTWQRTDWLRCSSTGDGLLWMTSSL
jgi:hypothetical protein